MGKSLESELGWVDRVATAPTWQKSLVAGILGTFLGVLAVAGAEPGIRGVVAPFAVATTLVSAAIMIFPPLRLYAASAATGSLALFLQYAIFGTCTPGIVGSWVQECGSISTTLDYKSTPESVVEKMVLRLYNDKVELMAGWSRSDYNRFFTLSPPTLFELQGVQYVYDQFAVREGFPVQLIMNDKSIPMVSMSDGIWTTDDSAVPILAALLKPGSNLYIEHYNPQGHQFTRLPEDGLREALAGLK